VKRIIVAGLCAIFSMGAAAASAADRETGVHIGRMTLGYTYFNRTGASRAAHDGAVADCVQAAGKLWTPSDYVNADGSLVMTPEGGNNSASVRGTLGAALESCMVVRGYRVVQLPDAEGAGLAGLDKEGLAARLEPWIGAAEPHGAVVRSWSNDARNGAIARFTFYPAFTDDGSLSLKAATGHTLGTFPRDGRARPAAGKLDPAFPKKAIKPEQIATLPPEAAVAVIRIKNLSLRQGIGLDFRRIGDAPESRPSATDHRPDAFTVKVGLIAAKKEGNWVVMPIAPGRWRINGLGVNGTLNLCLGSPAFEAKAGEIIYLGTFDISGDVLGPDLDIEAARTFLAGQEAAGRITPAAYVNGVRGVCADESIYALEIPGAPFEPGYAWGGQASFAGAPAAR
jgi:hypothetical protein